MLLGALLATSAVAGYLYTQSWFQLSTDEQIEPSPCPVCGTTAPFKTRKGRKHAECPTCGAYERHRLLLHYITHRDDLLQPGSSVLHFAANRGIEKQLRAREGLRYVTADLFAPADLELDLTAIAQPDASWDLVLCYHVLEHVDDDRKAMAELFRIVAPGGYAIVQVPLEHGRDDTYEDPSITSPEGRLEAFGQEDHVRLYGAVDFERRLADAGFSVEAVDYLAQLPPEVVTRHRLGRDEPDDPADERIFVLRKPAS